MHQLFSPATSPFDLSGCQDTMTEKGRDPNKKLFNELSSGIDLLKDDVSAELILQRIRSFVNRDILRVPDISIRNSWSGT